MYISVTKREPIQGFETNGRWYHHRPRPVYGLGLVQAGLRRYHFHETSACDGIISHDSQIMIHYSQIIIHWQSFNLYQKKHIRLNLMIQIQPTTHDSYMYYSWKDISSVNDWTLNFDYSNHDFQFISAWINPTFSWLDSQISKFNPNDPFPWQQIEYLR